MNRFVLFLFGISIYFLPNNPICAQTAASIAERLGFPADAKLLIIHADDLGMAHSVNSATFDALNNGPVNSASIMAPTPWLTEVAEMAKANPAYDLGVHLTLTSEWLYLKWGSVASRDAVSSLLDENGYFYDNCESLGAHAKPAELELELRAQIERVKTLGINPTHFDTHMGCLLRTNTALLSTYLKLGREYKTPLRLGRNLVESLPDSLRSLIAENDILIDHVHSATPEDFKQGMAAFYENILLHLKPGVNEIIVHLATKDPEMRGVAYNHPDWGANWRQADLDFFKSNRCKELLRQQNIQLITFREIGKLLK